MITILGDINPESLGLVTSITGGLSKYAHRNRVGVIFGFAKIN